MRRHWVWLVYLISILLAGASAYALAAFMLQDATRQIEAGSENSAGLLVLAALGVLLAGIAVGIVLLVLTIRAMHRTYRRARRRHGKYTRRERSLLAAHEHERVEWDRARAVRAYLLDRKVPPGLTVWDIVPYADESMFEQIEIDYARYYGRDVTVPSSGGFFFGRPAFVAAAMAVSAIGDSVAVARARADAAPQWRDWERTTAVVTNRRLAVRVRGEWLSFDYSRMSAVYPEVAAATLVCQFDGSVAPLLLTGQNTGVASVYSVLMTRGIEALELHPSLRVLDRPYGPAVLPPIGRDKPRPV